MFYEEKEINELIICPYCKLRYSDPRLLPCGLSLCFDCIQLLTDYDTNFISCACNSTHQIPNNGFLKNTGISRLAETIPNEVFRSSIVEDFKKNLAEMKQKLDTFRNEVNKGKDKIFEDCGMIKNEIQLKTESLIEVIKLISLGLIKQVDDYEKDCLFNFEKSVGNLNFTNEKLINASDFYLKWSQYLKNYSILEKQILKANEDTNKLLDLLDKQFDEYKSELFGGILIEFRGNNHALNSGFIGSLTYDNINLEKAVNQVVSRQNKVICQKHMIKSFLS